MVSQGLTIGIIAFIILVSIAAMLFGSYMILSNSNIGSDLTSVSSPKPGSSDGDSGATVAQSDSGFEEGIAVGSSFDEYVQAMEKCDIQKANSLVTKKSLEILRPTCSNPKAEAQCYSNKTQRVISVKGDGAVLHFNPFNHMSGWPIFFAKEEGKWKIDFYKMSFGIAMVGEGCDTGWTWRDSRTKDEFCSYFKSGQCPEK